MDLDFGTNCLDQTSHAKVLNEDRVNPGSSYLFNNGNQRLHFLWKHQRVQGDVGTHPSSSKMLGQIG